MISGSSMYTVSDGCDLPGSSYWPRLIVTRHVTVTQQTFKFSITIVVSHSERPSTVQFLLHATPLPPYIKRYIIPTTKFINCICQCPGSLLKKTVRCSHCGHPYFSLLTGDCYYSDDIQWPGHGESFKETQTERCALYDCYARQAYTQ